MKTIAPLILCLASVALADDFKTLDGKEYKDATVRRVEPDGIVVATKSGMSKLYFTELPKEVHDRFLGNYGSETDLRARYSRLQQQEQALLEQIGQANEAKIHKKRRRAKHLNEMNELTAQLPALHKQLDDVRAGMRDVKIQLDTLDSLRANWSLPDTASHQ